MEDLRAAAEDASSLVPPGPDQERVADARSIVTFSPGTHVWCVMVGRLRFDAGGVDEAVDAIRGSIGSRGRSASVWVVGDSATPPGLAADLERRGLVRSDTSDVLILHRPPSIPRSATFEIRAVASPADLQRWIEVSAGGFGWPTEVVDDEIARAEATLRSERADPSSMRLTALDGGRPVGVMRAWFAPWGAYLGGAATLPTDRRRGAMTSLVGAAWDEAARRGTPGLVAYGGAMSTPTFLGLGFERTGSVVHLVDRL
jgi:hypothetical protein